MGRRKKEGSGEGRNDSVHVRVFVWNGADNLQKVVPHKNSTVENAGKGLNIPLK